MGQAARKIEYATEQHEKADELLRSIKDEQESLAALQEGYF